MLARRDGEPAGGGLYTRPLDGLAEVAGIGVLPEHRRRGIARTLMAETERRAVQAGATLMTLEVRRSNSAALELYRTFDYRAVGVRPNYYVDEGEDAIVMVKELRKR
jgi:ribosomal-protein-alanine N-acetyltransferase